VKVKFTIPPFYGLYDVEAYLDWEIVDNKFSSHLVPKQHHVRQTTSEFKDFAIIWWNELSSLRLQPNTGDRLKAAIHERFVPPTYQRDLRKKLQRLDQGDLSIQDYYAKLQKGMIHAGVHEETEDKICHFYSWLHTEIQDIVDYKEYNNVNRLFQLAMLAEKELQGHQPMKTKTSVMPHSTSTAPSRTSTHSGAHSSMMNSASRPPSTSSTPSIIAPHATDLSEASILQGAGAAKPSSSTIPIRHTLDIKCHRCHGIGNFQRDCPSKKSYIATTDDSYVSGSDTEDNLALQTNYAGHLADDDDDDEHAFGSKQTAEYSTNTYVVQHILSAHMD
jgi:hypothetical protein